MSADELKSPELLKEVTELQKQNMKDAQMPMKERPVSSTLRCSNPKCRNRPTVAYDQVSPSIGVSIINADYCTGSNPKRR